MSDTASASGEISKPKELSYDEAIKGFSDQLKEIEKWIKMSYNLQLSEARARRKAQLELYKRLKAQLKKEEEEEEEDEEEEEEEEEVEDEEEARKKELYEELKRKLEEARKRLEEARIKREASIKPEPKGNVGELTGKEATSSISQAEELFKNVPETVREYMKELTQLSAKAKEMGLFQS